MHSETGSNQPSNAHRRLLIITGANALDPNAEHAPGTTQSKWWACERIVSIFGRNLFFLHVLLAHRKEGPEAWAADLALRRRLHVVQFGHDGRRHENGSPDGMWAPKWHKQFAFVERANRPFARDGAMMRAAEAAQAKGWRVEVHALAAPWGKSPSAKHVIKCARAAALSVTIHRCPMAYSVAGVALSDAEKGHAFAQERGPWVYFIRDASGFVKIGWTADVPKRVSVLQVAHATALEVILQIPGNARTERELHELFDEYRMAGEWFIYGARMRSFVWRATQRRQRGTITADDMLKVVAETAVAHPGG